jgi:hypothetical protein
LVEELPITHANLTLTSILSTDYDVYKISNDTNISILKVDIEDIENNYVTNISLLLVVQQIRIIIWLCV